MKGCKASSYFSIAFANSSALNPYISSLTNEPASRYFNFLASNPILFSAAFDCIFVALEVRASLILFCFCSISKLR